MGNRHYARVTRALAGCVFSLCAGVAAAQPYPSKGSS